MNIVNSVSYGVIELGKDFVNSPLMKPECGKQSANTEVFNAERLREKLRIL